MPTTNYPPHADSSGFVSGLMIGLVAGAAGAHFLQNTEKGRELFEKLKEQVGRPAKNYGPSPRRRKQCGQSRGRRHYSRIRSYQQEIFLPAPWPLPREIVCYNSSHEIL